MFKKARVLLADDHSITLTGIRSLVEREHELIGQVSDGRSLVESALRLRPDLVILDIGMPLLNGIEAARQIKESWPAAKLLFVTMHSNHMYLREAMNVGASGYVLKSSAAEELLPAIRTVLAGQTYVSPSFGPDVMDDLRMMSQPRRRAATSLTGRQREVVQLVAEGKTNKEIATILGMSVKTVEFHRARIMRHLGLGSTAELTAFAVREGVVNV